MIGAKDRVIHLATIDALAFVERFGSGTGGTTEDIWIGEVWATAVGDACLTDYEATRLRPLYRRELRREANRLRSITE